ncbi:MAG: 2-amino-4-hydroxy-6-hydroxymethyldihydropteridine diphosphokinase [Chitinophagales bacterium]|nr:2-amino-4-hydroxy-6-hydroxymethyldihydropteridine diphosphokinase [Chitinophagales bacterium]
MQACLLLGGNVGNRKAYLDFARFFIQRDLATIVQESKIYETEAWGEISTKAFLNQVLLVRTQLNPQELLQACLAIELKAGRKRRVKWEDRSLDIDILFYENLILKDTNLSIPHPEIPNRRFTLVALNELIPDYVHPILQKKVSELLDICPDKLKVQIYNSSLV